MQTSEIISVNVWQIIISLCNLLIIFVILKKLLFKPIQKMLDKRKNMIDEQYDNAQKAQDEAEAAKAEWDDKMSTADAEAKDIIDSANKRAEKINEKATLEAREKADAIVRQAQVDADLERKKAVDDIKREIVDVSSCLAEKIIEREIDVDDHRKLIDSFIDKIGEDDDNQ